MDRKHRSGLSTALKRHRGPLSDTEDNVPSSEVNDVQKRRRLKLLGEENVSPNKSSSSRDHLCCAELEVKPDTPALCSVRSRVQQLTQRRAGGPLLAPRLSIIIQEGFKEHILIGEAEFSSRVERFNAPTTCPASPLPGNRCPRTLSNAVTNLQLKLEDSETPSSKQVSCIRQEREEELRLLRAQPIAKNVFLNQRFSDSSLTEQADLNVTGDEPLWVKDGSFTETSVTAKIHGVEPPIQDTARRQVTITDEELGEAELSSQDETNTAEMIDLMFKDMLEASAQGREKEGTEDYDSGIATVMRRKEKTELDNEKAEEGEDLEEIRELDSSVDELLTLPPSCILSPLSRSVEAVVTPMRLAASQPATPPSLPLTPEELTTPPADSAPLYSIDAYRTQRQSTKPAIQSVTPGLQRRAAEKFHPQKTVNTKDRIMVLNEESAKLQTVINQTLQALSCCTDEDHGRGSLEEAEAEKLLLVSCEKRAALLAEVTRLRERGISGELEGGDGEGDTSMSQHPCRGTVSINSVQLPLKVEFVCSARTQTGRPTHYFFVLIRYGPCNIVATPLATAADAQNGDTISFPTSITMQDIHSNFEIDVEVYSLSHTSGNTCNVDLRSSSRSKITPRKLLSTIKRSNHRVTSSTMPALNTRRTSHFSLVGSHKISLASLGHSKFPLDKIQFDGKIRRLLGDEFQEKVPFLSPLEGNIYLRLDSESHSNVQHQGFLTMFEVVNGFGAWHRRFFVLEGNHMSYWNHPNDQGSKVAEGSISLFSSSSQSVKPVKRDSCARPYTFELVSCIQTAQQNDQLALAKCWFSADTREDRKDWMEKLNQVLLDLHAWTHRALNHAGAQPNTQASSGNIRESSL
ncbi:anillin-like isoform X5 [Oncorhynchus nerka]|uniref:anillin-like isoform X5 n=1 Tax=Oncorhynchus nerka TaxID=8023 RepID=UPI001131C2D7|nr:anillin-like isoform X4 [Oncorhynchus nerka]